MAKMPKITVKARKATDYKRMATEAEVEAPSKLRTKDGKKIPGIGNPEIDNLATVKSMKTWILQLGTELQMERFLSGDKALQDVSVALANIIDIAAQVMEPEHFGNVGITPASIRKSNAAFKKRVARVDEEYGTGFLDNFESRYDLMDNNYTKAAKKAERYQ